VEEVDEPDRAVHLALGERADPLGLPDAGLGACLALRLVCGAVVRVGGQVDLGHVLEGAEVAGGGDAVLAEWCRSNRQGSGRGIEEVLKQGVLVVQLAQWT
jgi:hypothetical protein